MKTPRLIFGRPPEQPEPIYVFPLEDIAGEIRIMVTRDGPDRKCLLEVVRLVIKADSGAVGGGHELAVLSGTNGRVIETIKI